MVVDQGGRGDFVKLISHPTLQTEESLLKQCQFTQTRRSGPGGQHRNKTATAVVFEHLPSGIRGEAGERRSQADNRRIAFRRLRENLAVMLRSVPTSEANNDESVRALEIWNQYRETGFSIHPTNPDFPPLLAIVLDDLFAAQGRIRETAELWGTSTSQLLRFLKLHKAAWGTVQQWRKEAGLSALH